MAMSGARRRRLLALLKRHGLPPAELVDYRAWCAVRGMAPYGHELACAQRAIWGERRHQWVAACGVDEDTLGPVGGAPWNPDLI